MASETKELLKAIDLIIKDVDKNYDECLVEHFIESLKDYRRAGKMTVDTDIIDRLKLYFDHQSFVMLNQTRAFKILEAILFWSNSHLETLVHLESPWLPLLESFWKTVGTVVLNNNTAAMKVMFSILERLFNYVRFARGWLLDLEITPPLQLSIQINDIVDLIRHCIDTSNNYHTKSSAEDLLTIIITKKCQHPKTVKIKDFIEELMLKGSTSMTHVLIEALVMNRYTYQLELQYDIDNIIMKSLTSLSQPKENTIKLCECVALTNAPRETVIKELISKKNLQGLIVYLTYSKPKDSHFEQLLVTYILYPILAKCSGDETESLIGELEATREERDFMDRAIDGKTATLCLVQLHKIFKRVSNGATSFPTVKQRALNLIVQTATNYIRCHYSPECNGLHTKNIFQCFSLLHVILDLSDPCSNNRVYATNPVYKIYESMYEIVHENRRSVHSKPIFVQVVRLMVSAGRIYADRYIEHKNEDLVGTISAEIANFGSEFEDAELLYEITEYFRERLYAEYIECEGSLELAYSIYERTSDTDHRELHANLANLMLRIDMSVHEMYLRSFMTHTRYKDLPNIISEILIEKSAIPETVVKIIKTMYAHCEENCFKYFDKLHKSALINLARAFISVIRFCDEAGVKSAILLNHILASIMKKRDVKSVMKVLKHADILKFLYEVTISSSYSPDIVAQAIIAIDLIKKKVISKVSNAGEMIGDDQALVEFYTNYAVQDRILAEKRTICENRKKSSPDPASILLDYVEIINNYSGREISECY